MYMYMYTYQSRPVAWAISKCVDGVWPEEVVHEFCRVLIKITHIINFANSVG